MNVYERTQQRLKTVFDLFDNIYVSFSGGKDSGVLLNLSSTTSGGTDCGGESGCSTWITKSSTAIRSTTWTARWPRTPTSSTSTGCVPFKVRPAPRVRQYWPPWEESKRDV